MITGTSNGITTFSGELSKVPELFKIVLQRITTERDRNKQEWSKLVYRLESQAATLVSKLQASSVEERGTEVVASVWKELVSFLDSRLEKEKSPIRGFRPFVNFLNIQELPPNIVDEALVMWLKLEYETELYMLRYDNQTNTAVKKKIKEARLRRNAKFATMAIESVLVTAEAYEQPAVRLGVYHLPEHPDFEGTIPEIPREIFSGLSEEQDYFLQIWITFSGRLRVVVLQSSSLCDCCDHSDQQEVYHLSSADHTVSHQNMLAVAMTPEQLLGTVLVTDLVRKHREKAEKILTALVACLPSS